MDSDTNAMLERFAHGKASPLDVLSLVERAERLGMETVVVVVWRKRKPDRNKTIRLLGRSGPHSCADSEVVQAGDHMCSGRWRVADVRLWLMEHSREIDAARIARNS